MLEKLPADSPRVKTFEAVRDYQYVRKERVQLEKQIAPLQKRLTEVLTKEQAMMPCVQAVLLARGLAAGRILSTQILKKLNIALSQPHAVMALEGDFPVSSTRVSLKGSSVHLHIIFASPLFRGWECKSDLPGVIGTSYQSCPLSLETPVKPSENAVPQYASEAEQVMEIIYWDYDGRQLSFWNMGGRRAVFLLTMPVEEALGLPSNPPASVPASPVIANLGVGAGSVEGFEEWLKRVQSKEVPYSNNKL